MNGSARLNELMKKEIAGAIAAADAKQKAKAAAFYPKLVFEIGQLIIASPANTSATVTSKDEDKTYVNHLKNLFEADGYHVWLGTTGILHVGWADDHVTKVPKIL